MVFDSLSLATSHMVRCDKTILFWRNLIVQTMSLTLNDVAGQCTVPFSHASRATVN